MVVGVTGLGDNECCCMGNGAVYELEYIFFGRIPGTTFCMKQEEINLKKIRCGFCVGKSWFCPSDLLVSWRPKNLGYLFGTAREKTGDLRGNKFALEARWPRRGRRHH